MIKISSKIFPHLVQLYDDVLSERQIKDIFNFVKSLNADLMKKGMTGNVRSSASSFEFTDILKDIKENVVSCSNIIDILSECLREYEQECGLHELFITNSWFNIQEINSRLEYHTHCGSIISGAFYINVDDQSSKFVMMNPNNRNLYFDSVRYPSEFNTDKISIKPKNNSLILFPSWILHGSDCIINKTNDRTVISFNTSTFEKDFYIRK